MGVAKRAIHERRDASGRGSKNRGSVNNARRLSAFAGKQKGARADWGGCNPTWLQSIVVGITRLGGAVTFGTSRDGGAYSVTLMLDGERETLWFNGGAELDEELELVVATLDSLA